jgi:hypothetical protein
MARIMLAITTPLILLVAPLAAQLQENEQQTTPSRHTRRGSRPVAAPTFNPVVLRLKYADCFEVATMIQKLVPEGGAYAESRSNSVIYTGPDDTAETIRELVEKLDQPVETTHASEVVPVQIRHRRAQDLARQIAATLGAGRLRVADDGRSTVLLYGPRPLIDSAIAIVHEVDRPAATVNLEFAFFHADLNDQKPAAGIPADLADVVDELQRFGGLKLLGRLSTVAIENEEFVIQGGIIGQLSTRVTGALLNASTGNSVKLEIRADLVLEKSALAATGKEGERPAPLPEFELRTIVTTQRGDYVVLGSAPTGWTPGESAILVLHVRP